MKLQGKDIYLTTLEREDCKKVWNDFEYDFEHPTEEFNIGFSYEKADEWFDDIQRLQGNTNIRLGIFLNDGTPIGDVAIQEINLKYRSASVGMGISKLCYRSKGYGKQALNLILQLGFCYVGLERMTANTLEMNVGARRSLETCGFILEGRESYLYEWT